MPHIDPKRVQDARFRLDLSQEQVASRSNLSASTISNIERGLFEPRGRTVYRLAIALETTPEALLGIEEPIEEVAT